MSNPPPPPGVRGGQLREEAAAWFARMRGEDAHRYRTAFEAWLARGALHRAAYNRMGEIFAAGKALKNEDPRSSGVARAKVARASASLALFAIMAASLLLFTPWMLAGSSESGRAGDGRKAEDRHRSGLHRVTLVALGDEAAVILDRDSLLAESIDGRPGVLRFERGRARFKVPDGSVQAILAGPGAIVSPEGMFDLWLRSDGSLDVQVLAGKIGLKPTTTGLAGVPRALVRLSAGQRYRLSLLGQGAPLADLAGSDWPSGILAFRQTRLPEVLEEANRYATVKIVLGDAATAEKRVSGRFRIDQPVRLAEHLALALSLTIDRRSPGMLVLREKRTKGSKQP